MNEVGKTSDAVTAEVIRGRKIEEKGAWKGVFDVEHWRGGELLSHQVCENLLTTEGKRYIIDIAMKGATSTYTIHQTWYVVLAGTNTTPDAGMNYDVPVFTEFVDYDELVRQTWNGTLHPSLAQMDNNSAKITINASASGTIYGAGLVTLDTKGNHAAGDYLLNFSLFAVPITVADNDVVKIGVSVALS